MPNLQTIMNRTSRLMAVDSWDGGDIDRYSVAIIITIINTSIVSKF